MSNKLLIISRCHEPRGGADRIIADLCRHLPARGWDVVLGLTEGLRFDRPSEYLKIHTDLPVITIDGRLGTRESRLRSLHRTIVRQAPDVVLSMRVFDVYEVVSRLKVASRQAPRLAVGVRAFEPPFFADVQRYREFLDLCVTSGEMIARGCRELCGINANRVTSIGGGVRPSFSQQRQQPFGSPLKLLYAGRLEQHQKRVLDLIGLVRSLQARQISFQLHIAGMGSAESQLKQALATEVNRGEVFFHGWVSQDELYTTHYPQADVFIHLADFEGITIAPREAMAHGVVPVISDFPGAREEGQFVDESTALTFPIGDMEAAAECVARLTKPSELWERLSLAAASSQTGRYSFDGAIDAWAEALNQTMAQPAMVGAQVPNIPTQLDGRLTKLGVPRRLQTTIRHLFGVPVKHGTAGSEWPTSSGLLTRDERRRITEFSIGSQQVSPNIGYGDS